jgi:uncharacterized protein (TIGR02145 family)
MRTQLTNAMANNIRPLLVAALGFALAFTLSCHDGGSDDNQVINPDTGISSPGGNGNSSPSGTGGGSSSSSPANIFVGDKGAFKDNRDGQTYNWVKIGTQIWMAENLNYHEEWVGPTRGNRCYNNIDANCDKYGRLYEWDDAIRVCPDGWHLPTKPEWDLLINFVGSNPGKKLKSASSDWRDSVGTDEYGFGGLPGGILRSDFERLNVNGYWWTATEDRTDWAYSKDMSSGNGVGLGYNGDNTTKTNHISVRCVEGSFSSSSIAYGEIIDNRDNQRYITVKIGTQTWMVQNLNYAGTNPQKGLCYNNKTENCDKYGRLYDWATAMNVSKDYNGNKLADQFPVLGQHQGICPEGWHLPTRPEWDALINFVGYYPGKKLKARSSEWQDNYGTDNYGFWGLPGGILISDFERLNVNGYWWTASEDRNNWAYSKDMSSNNNVGRGYNGDNTTKTSHISVRCVED